MKAAKKTNVERILEQASIEHITHSFDGRGGKADAAEIAAQLGVPADQVFKTLVTETEHHEAYVFVVPAAGELDLKKAAKAAGVRSLAMLPLAKLFPLTGYIHGGCSPLGMRKHFPTFIDETAQLFDHIYVSAGQVGLNVEVPPEALAALVPATFVDISREKAIH